MGALRLRLLVSHWILALRLLVGRRRALLVLRHERVELFLGLGVTQAMEGILELDLLFLEALQGFGAELVEVAVADRGRDERDAGALRMAASPRPLVLLP